MRDIYVYSTCTDQEDGVFDSSIACDEVAIYVVCALICSVLLRTVYIAPGKAKGLTTTLDTTL